MKYEWVLRSHRQQATELGKEMIHQTPSDVMASPTIADTHADKSRIPQKERARRDAIMRGLWVEKVEDNSCACCYKIKADDGKRGSKSANDRDEPDNTAENHERQSNYFSAIHYE